MILEELEAQLNFLLDYCSKNRIRPERAFGIPKYIEVSFEHGIKQINVGLISRIGLAIEKLRQLAADGFQDCGVFMPLSVPLGYRYATMDDETGQWTAWSTESPPLPSAEAKSHVQGLRQSTLSIPRYLKLGPPYHRKIPRTTMGWRDSIHIRDLKTGLWRLPENSVDIPNIPDVEVIKTAAKLPPWQLIELHDAKIRRYGYATPEAVED